MSTADEEFRRDETADEPQGSGGVDKEMGMIGIDVSKESLSVCAWDGVDQRERWQRVVPNSVAGVQALLERTSPQEPWALEPTGRYSELVARLGIEHGRRVLVAPPKAAKQFLASVSPRAKTDRLDARGLAHYACSVGLRLFAPKSEQMEKLSQLLGARKSIARSLATFRLQLQSLPMAQVPLRAAEAALAEQLKALDKELGELARQQPAVAALQRVPGIGPVTAAALVVRLKSTEFASYDQFVAYVGLDVRVRQSGQREGRMGLSRHGDAELRRLLYCCAQASLRTKDSPFAQQYAREREKGLASTQALCAVARKMAKVAWALVRTGVQYDPDRVYLQPKP
jgi:transposase